MLWRSTELTGLNITAIDGSAGSVRDIYFDDDSWTVRWLVIDTGGWLPGRQVLLPPSAFDTAAGSGDLATSLSRQQIEESPEVGNDAPVSRQQQQDIYTYYGWAPYWAGYPYPFAIAPVPAASPSLVPEHERKLNEERGDPHLRSAREVIGYYIAANDGDIGHVDDLLIDDADWTVQHMVVDTQNWWPGQKVLIPPRRVNSFNWNEQRAFVEMSREAVKESPELSESIHSPGR